MWQENSFFSMSGTSSTEVLLKTRAKTSFHKQHKQYISRFLVQLYHQIFENGPAHLGLCSGNQPLLFWQLDFYNYCTETKLVPLCFRALVWCKNFPLPERPFKCVLLSGEIRLCKTIHWLYKGGKWEQGYFLQNGHNCHHKKLQKTRDCSISKASLLRKATLASFPHQLLLSLWQINQCLSSSSMSTGVGKGVSFPWKAFQKYSL